MAGDVIVVRDHYNMVLFSFILYGIGALAPWNMFITAKEYFTDFKFSEEYIGRPTPFARIFMQYMTLASEVPMVFFSYINIFIRMGGSLSMGIVIAVVLQLILFILTVFLAMINTSGWPGLFFGLTILSVVCMNCGSGVYENTIFGLAAKLPVKYTRAVILGQNVSGVMTSLLKLIADAVTSNQRTAAIYYFITAIVVLLAVIDLYFALPLSRYFRYYDWKTQTAENRGTKVAVIRVPYRKVLKDSAVQLYNVFMIFVVTIACFPAMNADIKRVNKNFFIPEKHFTMITCFLTFNVFALLGNILAEFVHFPSRKWLIVPVTLRLLFIPFYLFCNYQPIGVKRSWPVIFANDWIYWTIGTMGLAFTSGYFCSLAMMYAPQSVEPQYAPTAGMFSAAMLVTGILVGIVVAFAWPLII